MLQYDWLSSDHMIIKEMFYIPIKLKPKLPRASMTTSDVNNQWRSNFQQQIIYNTNKIHYEKFNCIKFWGDLNVIIRIECIFCSFIIKACKSVDRGTFFV